MSVYTSASEQQSHKTLQAVNAQCFICLISLLWSNIYTESGPVRGNVWNLCLVWSPTETTCLLPVVLPAVIPVAVVAAVAADVGIPPAGAVGPTPGH